MLSQPYKLMTICYYLFIDLPSYWIFYCHERSEVTLLLRALFRLHGDILRIVRRVVVVWGRDELLRDGNRYLDSDYTEWKLVMSNVSISNFLTIPTPVIFLQMY